MADNIPNVLTIAGSDASGGAGIQADIKTFTALKVYAASVVTSVTAQNSSGIVHRHDLPTDAVAHQLKALLKDVEFAAIKIGMIPNEDIAKEIYTLLFNLNIPIVVDPVISSTSGARLITGAGKIFLENKLLPLASLITPNIHESAELLKCTEAQIKDNLKLSSKHLYDKFSCPVLLKGGHFEEDICIDTFFDGNDLKQFKNEKIRTSNTHGTGCTLSSCIAAYLAKGYTLFESIDKSIYQIQHAIRQSGDILMYKSGYGPINHLAIN